MFKVFKEKIKEFFSLLWGTDEFRTFIYAIGFILATICILIPLAIGIVEVCYKFWMWVGIL